MFLLVLAGCVAEEQGCEGLWGDVEAPGAWWVDASAEAEGDGRQESPVRSLSRVPPGGHAVLAAGVHELPEGPLSGTVQGVCPSLTRLVGDVEVQESLRLQDLTLEGALGGTGTLVGADLVVEEGLLWAQGPAADLTCEDCEVVGAPLFGLAAWDGASATLRRTVIRDVQEVDGHAFGVRGTEGASILLEEVRVERIPGHGIAVLESILELHGVLVQDVASEHIDVFGLFLSRGSRGVGTDVALRGVLGFGVAVEDEAELQVVGLSVRGVRGAGQLGPAIAVHRGGSVEVDDLLVDDCQSAALVAGEAGILRVREGLVRGTISTNGNLPMDLVALAGGLVEATGLDLMGEGAVGAVSQTGILSLTDAFFGPSTADGAWAVDGGAIRLTDVVMQERTAVGVGADWSLVVAEGLTVVGTRRPIELKLAAGAASVRGGALQLTDYHALDTEGYGLIVEGSTASCTDCEVEDSLLAGVLCANDAVCLLTDTWVHGVQPEGASGLAMGVFVGAGGGDDARLRADGLFVEEAGHAAVWVEGGYLEAVGSELHGGPQVELLPDVFAYGHGVYSMEGEVFLQHTLLAGAAGAGLFSHGGYVAVQDVRFQDNALDVVLQACDQEVLLPQDIDALVCPEEWLPTVPMSYFGIVVLEDAG